MSGKGTFKTYKLPDCHRPAIFFRKTKKMGRRDMNCPNL